MMDLTQRRGFTLMEVLVAMTIMAIVFTSLGTAFSQLALGARSLESTGEDRLAMGDAAEWLRKDLESLYVDHTPMLAANAGVDDEDPYRFVLSTETVGSETVSKLRFTSTNHLPFGDDISKGIAEIVYYVTERGSGLVLRRSDRLFFHESFEPEDEHPVVMRSLAGFSVQAVDAEGTRHEEWDSDDTGTGRSTPLALEITLKRGDGNERARSFPVAVLLRSVRKGALDG